MPHPFKAYEVEVLGMILADEYSPRELSALLDGPSTIQVEYTNYGFYISVENSSIGKERRVYSSDPSLIGRWNNKDAGFVAFLEDNHLTLEIHPWDGESLPATFRDCDVQVIRGPSNQP